MGTRMEERASTLPISKPSLFLAAKLTSIVQKFRHRLEQKVQQRKKTVSPFGPAYHRGLRLRALSDLERVAIPRRLFIGDEPRSAADHPDHGRWVNGLLHDLDDHTPSKAYPLTKVAANDKLFLNASQHILVQAFAERVNLPHAAYLFDSCCLLINKLEVIQTDNGGNSEPWSEYESNHKRLKDEKFIANLLHLLRRLQHILFQILVHKSIKRLDEFATSFHDYWQQQKKVDEDWFTEWPSGERPLSTTWPWNIRPSLVVLWGVCWKFYGEEGEQSDSQGSGSRVRRQQIMDSVGFMESWQHNISQTDLDEAANIHIADPPITQAMYAQAEDESFSMAQAAIIGTGSRRRHSAVAAPQGAEQGSLALTTPQFFSPGPQRINVVHEPPRRSFIPTTPALTSVSSPYNNETLPPGPPTFGSRDPRWPVASGGDFSSYAISAQNDEYWHPYESQVSQAFLPPQAAAVPTLELSPVNGPTYSLTHNTPVPYTPYNQRPQYPLNVMGGVIDYPSPSSDRAAPRHSTTTSASPNLSIMPSPVIADQTSPSSDGSPSRSRVPVRRGEPPRDDHGNIYCNHQNCGPDPPVFRRPCEWNKHMDKHDRPYKCDDPNCEKIQGFTYSGGLLRHQREVHKKNVTARQPLFCKYPSCNRHSGVGFTRQENLKEHMRRRHVGESEIDIQPEMGTISRRQTGASENMTAPARKRKRTMDSELDADEEDSGTDSDDLREQIKRLKEEAEQKDRKVRQLEVTVNQLTQLLSAQPSSRA